MKILILANSDIGLYQFRRELISELLKAHEVVIALPDGDLVRPLEEMGCKFYDVFVDRRGIDPIKDIVLLYRYMQLLRKERPDLVITYTIKPNIYGGINCRLLRIPYAANITGLGTSFQKSGFLRKLVVFLYKTSLKCAKIVFFENIENMKTFLREKIVRDDCCKCFNGAGVNLEHYTVAAYPTEEMPVRFLFMGRIMAEKGINELLETVRRLNENGYDCTLDILGQMEESYKPRLQKAENEGCVRYFDYQKDIRPFVAHSHCFVLPSWHEGMANTNLECAAMGRPVITSNIHGCKEAVIENVSGFLCEVQDEDSLYEAMEKFVRKNDRERADMGLAGRAHMECAFDKRKIVAQTMDALKKRINMVG